MPQQIDTEHTNICSTSDSVTFTHSEFRQGQIYILCSSTMKGVGAYKWVVQI